MKLNKSAKQFSNVLFKCASDAGALDEVRDSIVLFDELIRSNTELKSFVQSKRISRDHKLEILIQVLGSSVHGLVLGIVSYLNGTRINNVINQIKNYYLIFYKQIKNKISVHAFVSNELEKKDILIMKEKLDQILNGDTELSIEIDESLIGGVKLRVENIYLDASIRSQINNLKSNLMKT